MKMVINGIENSKKEAKMENITRFFQKSEQSFFLFGPRGTGKSTWIHQHMSNALIIDLLHVAGRFINKNAELYY